jgi:HJR/Mrr/RecB family endonuclease
MLFKQEFTFFAVPVPLIEIDVKQARSSVSTEKVEELGAAEHLYTVRTAMLASE